MLAREQCRRREERPPAFRTSRRRTPPEAPPRSCRSRHRRRPGDPSAGRMRDLRAPARSRDPDPPSPDRRSAPRIRRTGRPVSSIASPFRVARSRRKLDQLARNLLNALLDACAFRCCQPSPPSLSSWTMAVARAVAGEHIQVLDRDEQAIAAVIGELQAVMGRTAQAPGSPAPRIGRCRGPHGRRHRPRQGRRPRE